MTTIYLIRHAEAEGNLYRRCHGHYNSIITGNGYHQIEALKKRFESVHIDAVYSSDLFRTCETAKAVWVPKELELHKDPELREIGCGIWEDMPWSNIDRIDHDELAKFTACDESWHIEGGETYPLVRERMRSALKRIADRHNGQTVAVFSHGMAMRTIVSSYYGLPINGIPHCDNTAVTKLEFDAGEVRVIKWGDASHVPEEYSTFARQSWWRKSTGAVKDAQMWFRPLEMPEESDFYRACRKEAWLTIHKNYDSYDEDTFLQVALKNSLYSEKSVVAACVGDNTAGLLQMDFERDAAKGIGWIPFCYMMPDYRRGGLGCQLIGQAVSEYRRLGRKKLRLRCAPDNDTALRFYRRYGFAEAGYADDSAVPLLLLDKPLWAEE